MTGWPGRRGQPRPTRAPARDRRGYGRPEPLRRLRSNSFNRNATARSLRPRRIEMRFGGSFFSSSARRRSSSSSLHKRDLFPCIGILHARRYDAPADGRSRRCLLPPGTDWLFRRARPRPGRTDRKAVRRVTGSRVLLRLAGRRPRGIGRGLIVRRAGPVRRAGRVAAGGAATGIEIVLRLIGGRRRWRCVRAGPARAGRRVTGRARSSRPHAGSSRRARATRGRASSTAPGSRAPGTGASSAPSTSRALRIDAGGGRQRRE